MRTAQQVLAFWLDEVGPDGWYRGDAALDDTVRREFSDTLDHAAEGGLGLWLTCASECLAYILVCDQFSRNMHRDTPRAFATDLLAVAAAKVALSKGWDMQIDPPARQFFYLPLMHAENIFDQNRCVRLFCSRMPDSGGSNLDHAMAHREVIRRFGRFPTRNAALGRKSTTAEQVYLDSGGYGEVLRALQAGAH